MDEIFGMAWWPGMTANRAGARRQRTRTSPSYCRKPKRDSGKEKAARKAQRAARKKQRR